MTKGDNVALTGTVAGNSRADLITKATKEARTYYETECVQVELNREESETEYATDRQHGQPGQQIALRTTYTANYAAQEKHYSQGGWIPTGQPHKCKCGKELK